MRCVLGYEGKFGTAFNLGQACISSLTEKTCQRLYCITSKFCNFYKSSSNVIKLFSNVNNLHS